MNRDKYSTAAPRRQRPRAFALPLHRLTRREVEDAIDHLLDHLDAIDGDPDAEPEEREEDDMEGSLQPVSLDRVLLRELRA